jgi:hypothetical protein
MQTNHIRRKHKSTFQFTRQNWLKISAKACDNVILKGDGEPLTHQEYVNFFIHTIEKIVQNNNYTILDKKKFKDDLCKFIYTLSDNG